MIMYWYLLSIYSHRRAQHQLSFNHTYYLFSYLFHTMASYINNVSKAFPSRETFGILEGKEVRNIFILIWKYN